MTSGFCFLSQTSEISKFEIRNPKLSWLLRLPLRALPLQIALSPYRLPLCGPRKDGIGHE